MAITGTMTSSRKIRSLGILVLALGYGIWSYYDGWVNPKYLDLEKQGDRLFNQTMAVVMALLFIVLLVRLLVLWKSRVVMDEGGIHPSARRTIAWSAITRVDDRNLEKGLLEIYYKDGEGETEKKYTLDSYKTTGFDDMIQEFSVRRPDLLQIEGPEVPAIGKQMKEHKPVEAYIGLGSNLEPRGKYIERALNLIAEHPHMEVLTVSAVYETTPQGGPPGQGLYLNAAARIRTTLSAGELLGALQVIERELGRKRNIHWGPRTIDLDILLYGQEIISTDYLIVPHPLMHERRFVMEPLAQIAPDVVHPILQMTAKTILESLGEDD